MEFNYVNALVAEAATKIRELIRTHGPLTLGDIRKLERRQQVEEALSVGHLATPPTPMAILERAFAQVIHG